MPRLIDDLRATTKIGMPWFVEPSKETLWVDYAKRVLELVHESERTTASPGDPWRELLSYILNVRKSLSARPIKAAAIARRSLPCNRGGDPGHRSPHRRDGTPVLGNPTRLYGDLFEYDNSPLLENERRAIGMDGKESNWTPTRAVP